MAFSLRGYWPKSLPRDQDRAEVRIYCGMVGILFMAQLVEPAAYAWFVESSPLAKVVSITRSPCLALCLFFVSAAAFLPHLASLVFVPSLLVYKFPRRLACAGAAIAGLLWFSLANTARVLDYGPLPYFYAVRCVIDMFVAGTLGFSLNSQQLRERPEIKAQIR